MQQLVPDIDPWKFRVFSPEECPAEVLEKLPFGECIHVYGMRNPYNTVYGQTKSTVPDRFAREIMDRAYAEGKNNLYPELGFASCMIKCSEVLCNDARNHTLLMYTVPIKKGLINLNYSEESIEFWQDTYAPRVQLSAMNYCKSTLVGEDDTFMHSLIIPKVYYDVKENLIYNRVLKLRAGNTTIIPMYVSAFGGIVVVKAIHDCLIPLGTGRRWSRDYAIDWVRGSRENAAARDYHINTVSNTYNDYSCIEFNDKSILMDVLAKLPVRIVEELHTYRI